MNLTKITSLTSIGAALEYYDFVIYATLSHYLSTLFFPADDYHTSLLKAFAIFGIGYLVRPLGGMVMGLIGDRYGRKRVFVLSMMLMALATFMIGLLPTYAQVGILAPCLLMTCRIIQGISFGAELPGAITFLVEHTQTHRPSIHIAWMIFGVSLGSLLSSALYTLLTATFEHQALLDYAWRIPFILGGCLGVAGFILRKNSQETPSFQQHKPHQDSRSILLELFKCHGWRLLVGTSVTLLGGILIISYLYLPHYLTGGTLSIAEISFIFTLGFVWSALFIPLCGWITERLGVTLCLTMTFVLTLLLSVPMWALANPNHLSRLLCFALLYQTLSSLFAVNYTILLSQLFPVRVRYTGIAFCYNTAFAIAGSAPLILASILTR